MFIISPQFKLLIEVMKISRVLNWKIKHLGFCTFGIYIHWNINIWNIFIDSFRFSRVLIYIKREAFWYGQFISVFDARTHAIAFATCKLCTPLLLPPIMEKQITTCYFLVGHLLYGHIFICSQKFTGVRLAGHLDSWPH